MYWDVYAAMVLYAAVLFALYLALRGVKESAQR